MCQTPPLKKPWFVSRVTRLADSAVISSPGVARLADSAVISFPNMRPVAGKSSIHCPCASRELRQSGGLISYPGQDSNPRSELTFCFYNKMVKTLSSHLLSTINVCSAGVIDLLA